MLPMRFVAIGLLTGFLAWCAFASGDEGPYIMLGSGAESCTKLAAKPDASGDDPFTGLVRISCDLDGALLWMENYYRINTAVTLVDPSDRLMGRSRSARHGPGR
jgi:hypothetical protein